MRAASGEIRPVGTNTSNAGTNSRCHRRQVRGPRRLIRITVIARHVIRRGSMSFKIFVGPRANLFRPATLVLSACVVAVLGTNLANAAVPPSAPSIVVRYSDLDVATPNGAAKLYQRIASAAQKVCPDADSSRLEDKMATWSC